MQTECKDLGIPGKAHLATTTSLLPRVTPTRVGG